MWQSDSAPAQQTDSAATVPVPVPSALAIQYHRSSHVIWAGATALELAVPAALLFTGLSARVRDLARRIARGRWFLTAAIYGAAYVLIQAVAFLPFAWYAGFVRQHAYGLSTETSGQWLADWAKGTAITAVIAAGILWIPYRLLRASPRRWWLWTGLLAAPLTVLAMIVAPVWIAPLFDEYGPMRDRALEARIHQLAARAGIPDSRVYEVRKSDETRQVNAYVTGFGGTKRIVLWDTLVDRLEPDQVLFVMGHEIGHFVLRHTLTVILGATLLATLSLFVVHRLAGRLIARWPRCRCWSWSAARSCWRRRRRPWRSRAGRSGRPIASDSRLRATTRRPPGRSSGCTTRTSRCRGPASSSGCGAPAIRTWPTGSSSPIAIAPGPGGNRSAMAIASARRNR
jgi:STE24 endopeptidase